LDALDALSSSELERSVRAQASLRLKFGLFVLAVMLVAIGYWGPARPANQAWEIGGIGVAYLLYNFAAYYFTHHGRLVSARDMVIATAILDPLMLSGWLVVAGEASILFVGFYLFTILGFGFRIGRTAMHLCQAVSILGFGMVSVMSPAWREHPLFEVSHLVLLTVVPLYAGTLIRQLQAARHAAERASQAKSQLLAKVSHELRTPLTGIVSTASLVEAQSSDPDSVARAHSIIDLALGLDLEIKQLLDLSRIEAGRDEQQQIAFEIHQVTDHLLRTLQPIAAAKKVELRVEVDPELSGPVLGDAHALGSVLMNLAGNAVKFTDSGSVAVRIALLEQEGEAYRIRFSVQDTGIGIPEDLQERIFEPFFQVESGPVRKYGGTGLGTSIALAHVRRMGGELQLESAQGAGSRFWFDLRLARTTPRQAPAVQAPVRVVRDKHMLVADDNTTNLVLIKEMLERDGHRVVAVESGHAALEALATADFDVVFLDFNMHDMDGASVYEAYRFGRLRTAPTFFVTADTSALTASRLEALGAAGVIYKPVTFDKLRTAIAGEFPDDAVAAPAAPAQRPALHLRPVPVEYLDPAALETLREVRDSPEFLCRMISDGVLDIERIDQALAAALAACDVGMVHRQAHALRGVCLSLGAVRLAALADRLMTIGQRELEATAQERHADLRKTSDLSLAALDALRQALSSPEARAG
jgi:two-component system sensor histidine kinase RpfC